VCRWPFEKGIAIDGGIRRHARRIRIRPKSRLAAGSRMMVWREPVSKMARHRCGHPKSRECADASPCCSWCARARAPAGGPDASWPLAYILRGRWRNPRPRRTAGAGPGPVRRHRDVRFRPDINAASCVRGRRSQVPSPWQSGATPGH
jgi:hypothetical protein